MHDTISCLENRFKEIGKRTCLCQEYWGEMGKRSVCFLRNNTKGKNKQVKFLSLSLSNPSFVFSLLKRNEKRHYEMTPNFENPSDSTVWRDLRRGKCD